jgi:hypothetical protein
MTKDLCKIQEAGQFNKGGTPEIGAVEGERTVQRK